MQLYYNLCIKWKNEKNGRLLHSNYQTINASRRPRITRQAKDDCKGEVMHLINNARFTGTQESTGILLGKTSRCSFKLKYYTMMAFNVCHFDS